MFLIIPSLAWGALDFPGTGILSYPSSGGGGVGTPVTFSWWGYYDTTTTTNTDVMLKDITGNVGFLCRTSSTAGGTGEIRADFTTTDLSHRGDTNSVPTGQWINSICTWDGSTTATNAHFYVNGSEISYGTTTNGSGTATGTQGPLVISKASNDDSKKAFIGYWNRVLSASEIATLAKGYAPECIPNGLEAAPDLTREDFDPITFAATTGSGSFSVINNPPIIRCK